MLGNSLRTMKWAQFPYEPATMYITDLIPQLSTVSSSQVFCVALKIGVAPAAHRRLGYILKFLHTYLLVDFKSQISACIGAIGEVVCAQYK